MSLRYLFEICSMLNKKGKWAWGVTIVIPSCEPNETNPCNSIQWHWLATSFFFCNIPSLLFLPLLLCPLGGIETLTSWRDPSLLNWMEIIVIVTWTRIWGFYPLLLYTLIVVVPSTIVSARWDWNHNFLMRLISTQLGKDHCCCCYLDSNLEFLCCMDLWWGSSSAVIL